MVSNSRGKKEDLNQTPKPLFYVNPRLGGRSFEGQDPAGRQGPRMLPPSLSSLMRMPFSLWISKRLELGGGCGI